MVDFEAKQSRHTSVFMEALKSSELPAISSLVVSTLSSAGKGWWNPVTTPYDIFQLTKAYKLHKRLLLAIQHALRAAFWSYSFPLVQQVSLKFV